MKHFLFLMVWFLFFSVVYLYSLFESKIKSDAVVQSTSITQELTDWQVFVMALIEVESAYSLDAVGSCSDVGVLQITPVYVKDVNRILKDSLFSLADRFCVDKSLAMFTVMQSHYNPDFDIDKAIKLHNPNASDLYKRKIYKVMGEIRKKEFVRSFVVSH